VTEMVLYLYAESPVHAGGSESLGALDLPIQREATTRYPVIWGQSLKGALRQAAEDAARSVTAPPGGVTAPPGEAQGRWDTGMVLAVFGSEVGGGDEGGATSAGLLSVGDAQLVAMPVPTLQRTFAWVTSQLALARLARKYAHLPGAEVVPAVPVTAPDQGAAPAGEWIGAVEVLGPCLLELGAAANPALAGWAQRIARDLLGGEVPFGHLADKLRTDLLLAGADVMPTLLTECTEFVARVQLNDDKTVNNGPFYSEYLPAETIMAAVLHLRDTGNAARHQAALHGLLDGALHQIGGDQTIGKGLVWTRLLAGRA